MLMKLIVPLESFIADLACVNISYSVVIFDMPSFCPQALECSRAESAMKLWALLHNWERLLAVPLISVNLK